MMNELQLLKGLPIDIGSCKIYPLTLDEIVKMGEQTYNMYLRILMITKSDTDKENINPEMWDEFLKMDDYDFLLVSLLQNDEIKQAILASLSLFLNEPVSFNSEYGLFINRENYNSEYGIFTTQEDEIFIITKDIFNEIKRVINEQNFISNGTAKEEEFNPYDDKARELIEKRNKFKKMIQEANAEDGLNLSDIISIVASHSPTINFDNIWDLTIYRLYTIYLRMAMKDQYATYIHLLPHSSDNKNETKHWMSKINKIN